MQYTFALEDSTDLYQSSLKSSWRVTVQLLAHWLTLTQPILALEDIKSDSDELTAQFLIWLNNCSRFDAFWLHVWAREWKMSARVKRTGTWGFQDISAALEVECPTSAAYLEGQQLFFGEDTSNGIMVKVSAPETWQDLQYWVLDVAQAAVDDPSKRYIFNRAIIMVFQHYEDKNLKKLQRMLWDVGTWRASNIAGPRVEKSF